MDSTTNVNESIEQIMTEAAKACTRTLDRANHMAELAQRGRVSRNSNAYRKAWEAWSSACVRYGGLVDMWAAVTGADEAERSRFHNRFMLPASEAALTGSESR